MDNRNKQSTTSLLEFSHKIVDKNKINNWNCKMMAKKLFI